MVEEVSCQGTVSTPLTWPWAMQSAPLVCSKSSAWTRGLVRRWSGSSPIMVQPPLDHHYLVIHLDGAKRVKRRRDGPSMDTVVSDRSVTIVPAGNAYVWQTEGPISFGHLYIAPEVIEGVVAETFDVDIGDAPLTDKVGCRDAFLEPLLSNLIEEAQQGPEASVLRLDSLFDSICHQLARGYLARGPVAGAKVVALASHRLRRVLDFIESHLDRDLSLADLAAAAGSGQAHFSHAFRIATGCSPYQYLLRRRIEYAKLLLLTTDDPLDAIGRECGFQRSRQFARMFKHLVGLGPKRYRMACGRSHRGADYSACAK